MENNNKKLHIPAWLTDSIIRIEEQPEDKRLLLNIVGVRNLGKTTGLIQIFRHIASKQHPNRDGVRKLRMGLLRYAYKQFGQVIESFSEWFELQQFNDVLREKKLGFGYKNIDKAPEIVIFEKSQDFISMLLNEPPKWDGTYTKIHIVGLSYNKPSHDSHIRGENFGSGWVNEVQTVDPRGVDTLIGAIGRPEGKIVNPVLIQDSNFPESGDLGYDYLKSLYAMNGGTTDTNASVYFPKMPIPYSFDQDDRGDFIFEGRKGFLARNERFLHDVPHLNSFDSYELYKNKGDDAVRVNMLGMFGRSNSGILIYHEFDRDKHVKEIKIPNEIDHENKIILMTIDFGFKPGVQLWYVEHGIPRLFKDFAFEDINLFELLRDYVIPYIDEHLSYFMLRDQIVVIGDPISGAKRDAVKSSMPFKVLTGETDINGDEFGDATRYNFKNVVPSPCGNSIEHRLNVSKQILSKPMGVYISNICTLTIDSLEEKYVLGPSGKPLKGNDVYHGLADCFQYMCAYLVAGGETEVVIKRKKERKKRRSKYHR